MTQRFRLRVRDNAVPSLAGVLQERKRYCAEMRRSAAGVCRRLLHPRRVPCKAERLELSSNVCSLTRDQRCPQAHQPGTAFHNGTAPLVARARFAPSTPVVVRVRVASGAEAVNRSLESELKLSLHTLLLIKFLPTLLYCVLFCASPICPTVV